MVLWNRIYPSVPPFLCPGVSWELGCFIENNSLKNKNLRELKENFRTYGYPKKVFEIGIQKALKIPQTKLHQPKTIENNKLTFMSTFNPNNPKIFDLVKSGVNTLVEIGASPHTISWSKNFFST